MAKAAGFLISVIVAVGSACAAHGPFSGPLAVADTTGLLEGSRAGTPPRPTKIALPSGPFRPLGDTIVIRYVVDSSGATDPRTFEVIRGRDRDHIRALENAITLMRYDPAREAGHPVRSWLTIEMRPDAGRGIRLDMPSY